MVFSSLRLLLPTPSAAFEATRPSDEHLQSLFLRFRLAKLGLPSPRQADLIPIPFSFFCIFGVFVDPGASLVTAYMTDFGVLWRLRSLHDGLISHEQMG